MFNTEFSLNKACVLDDKNPFNRRLIAIYTVLQILMNMRDRLGLESMIYFLEKYSKTIERICPEVKAAVNEELIERALHELYQTICNEDK